MEFHRRPSIAACMLRGLHRRPGLSKARGFPPLRARWTGHRINRRHLAEFLRLTGLASDQDVSLLYLHVLGFPLQMAILTHPAFPIPLWSALQIRNHLLRHGPIAEDAALDLETAVAGQRILDKGAEVDLHTTVRAGKEVAWEGLTTVYYRGRFGEAGAMSPLSRAPEVAGEVRARWHTPPGGGWRFGRLTGDYNGVHWSRRYARMFGFRRNFEHPQRALGQCMARLRARCAAEGERLDAWLKGPVYYDSDVSLRVTAEPDGAVFALNVEGDDRPAIVGRYSAVAAESRLLA